MKVETVKQTKVTVESSTRNFAKLEFDTIVVSNRLNITLAGLDKQDLPFVVERSPWLNRDQVVLKLRGEYVAQVSLNEHIAAFK